MSTVRYGDVVQGEDPSSLQEKLKKRREAESSIEDAHEDAPTKSNTEKTKVSQ